MTAEAQAPLPRARLSAGFMLRHPARWLALGFGSGLSRWAPGTVGTLWAWMTFSIADPWVREFGWGWILLIAVMLGWWACAVTARDLGMADPSAIVWDEVVAFWLILWVITPAGWGLQILAFALFRLLDAAKPGPVAWADALFKDSTSAVWRGAGILFDDFVAAGCTLLGLAVWVFVRDLMF
jgi:phosphatidylglycerophosphatase A